MTTAHAPPGLVGVPVLPWVWTKCAVAIAGVTRCMPPGSRFLLAGGAEGSSSIACNRNALVQGMMAHAELEWLLFLDSDMVPPPDVLRRLLAHGSEPDVISACYWTRHPPHVPAFGALPGTPIVAIGGPLREVAWTGFGCVLVRRRVFEALPFPWFEHTTPGIGEDTLFCEKARALGFRVYVDPALDVGHMHVQEINASWAVTWQSSTDGIIAASRSAERLEKQRHSVAGRFHEAETARQVAVVTQGQKAPALAPRVIRTPPVT